MKFFAAFVAALLLVVSSARAQQSPDDQYVIIYVLIQQGDAYVNAGQAKQALSEYVEAQTELQKFQQVYGDWNPEIVKFRLKYLADRIAALTPDTTAKATTNAAPVVVTPPPTPADWQAQLATLNSQIQHLQGDSQTLQAKLKEALSAQPAEVSADQLAQVQQQVRDLTKENDLLKATVAQLTNSAPVRASQSSSQLQAALVAETARATELASQNQALQLRVQSLTTDAGSVEALRQENALLKKQLAGIGATSAAVSGSGSATEHAQIAQLQADAVADALEKQGLENRIRQMQEATLNSSGGATVSEVNLQSRINELTLERDNLLGQLGEANKKLYGHNNQSTAAQINTLAQQVDTLRARVAVDEAQTVPYTPQEMALFTPGPITPNPDAEKKSIHELPSGSSVLVAEAQSYFTNREYDMAAADYQKILQHDPNNPLALANLAAIELEENKNADADKHIQAALAQQPNDPYNLTILGRVKFNEQDYDGALNALDRAAKLDPQNPQIQNFLGVALAQKGMRVQAETSFRKAVQINPDYGDAHKNLAIIYLSANPPMVELARWHYEKALAAGVPPNADLEQMLNAVGSQK